MGGRKGESEGERGGGDIQKERDRELLNNLFNLSTGPDGSTGLNISPTELQIVQKV